MILLFPSHDIDAVIAYATFFDALYYLLLFAADARYAFFFVDVADDYFDDAATLRRLLMIDA